MDAQIAKTEADYAKLKAQWDEAEKREKLVIESGGRTTFYSPEAVGIRFKISENYQRQLAALKLQRYDIQKAYQLAPPTKAEKKK